MYKRATLILVVLMIIATLLATGCGKSKPSVQEPQPTVEPTPTAEPTVEVTPTPTVTTYKDALTGKDLTDEYISKLRPIAVMIDNQAQARPQSGISNADIVYEFPVEGKITRYMAIFHEGEADKIGPVRSARPYFLDTAMEYNAVYVHCGGSEQALSDIITLNINTLNDINGDPCFWRANDRVAPHNLYTSTKLMREVIANKKLENSPAPEIFKFTDTYTDLDGRTTNQIFINYDRGYKVSYQYDAANKVYNRLINGDKMKDKENSQEITTTNILIQRVSYKVLDDEGRLSLGNVGTGRGYFLTGGKLIEVKWSKKSRSSKTVYTDLKGNEIALNKGNTWIQVVPDYATVDM